MKNKYNVVNYLVIIILVFIGTKSFGFITNKGIKTNSCKQKNGLNIIPDIAMTTTTINDAGLEPSFLEPSSTLNSNTVTALKVVLKNYGQQSLTSVQIPYSINGIIADTFLWTGNLAYTQMDTVILDSISFVGGIYAIEAFTQLPNNTIDTVNTNDTAYANLSVCLSGAYTIGDTINGSADFGSFNGALSALNASGICGNVVFNVEAGTYSEQLTINPISGSSIANKITFQSLNGNNTSVILQYNSNGGSINHTIHIAGADNIKFQNMTIKSLASNSCKTIVIDGGADYISINNNIIIMPTSATSNAYGIYSNGDNDNYLSISNNHIINGVYGIYLKGASVTNREQYLTVTNNIIDDFLYYGIAVFYHNNSTINGNEVNASSNASYCEGIHVESSYNWFFVTNNKINVNVVNNNSTSTNFGLRVMFCNTTVNAPTNCGSGYVFNNMIAVTGNHNYKIGMQAYDNVDVKFYYNTVVISGGGYYNKALTEHDDFTTTNAQDFINNLFINLTGSGFAAEFTTPYFVGTVDYNVYYLTSGHLVFWNGNQNTIQSLQLASNKNMHSLKISPQFESASDLHLSSYDLLSTGVPISMVGIDIDGNDRSNVESMIGADEIPRLGIDVGVVEILNFPDTTIESYSYPISVRIRNFGTDTIDSIAINYTVNGGSIVTYNYSGNLAPYQYDTISLTPLIAPPLDNTLCINVVTANDSNSLNNTVCQDYYGKIHKDAVVSRIININGACNMGLDTIFVWVRNMGEDTINDIGQLGQTTLNYKIGYDSAANVVSENFDTLILPGDSFYYAFSTLLDFSNNSIHDSLFNISAWIDYPSDGLSNNDTAYMSVTSFRTVAAPTFTTPISLPYATSANITVGSPNAVYWYDSDTTTNYFYNGKSYITPIMFDNDTLWLQAQANDVIFKISETMQFKKLGYIFPSGFPTGDFDGVEISNLNVIKEDLSGYEINVYLNNTSKLSYVFPSGTFIDSGSVACVLYGSSLVLGPQGNNVFNIGNTFNIYSISSVSYWLKDPNGVVVDAFADNGAVFPAYSTVDSSDFTGQLIYATGYGAVRLISDNDTATDWANSVSSNFSFGSFNNQLSLEGEGACVENSVQMILNIGNQQNIDVSVTDIISPMSLINLTQAERVKVWVKNFGLTTLDSIPIAFRINNGLVVWDTIYSSIAPNDSLEFEFNSGADLSLPGVNYSVKVFTDLVSDTNYMNDTLVKNVNHLETNYCISKSTNPSPQCIVGCSVLPWSTSNPTSPSSYSDYTSLTPFPIVTRGIATDISISSNFNGTILINQPCYANVFIDLNRDGYFTSEERVFGGSTTSIDVINGSFTIPDSIQTGLTYMRIVLQVSGNINTTGPCGLYNNGETEDYKILIEDKLSEDVDLDSIMDIPSYSGNVNPDLKVKVINHGYDIIDSLDITYVLNGGLPVTTSFNSISITTLDSLIFNLGQINLQFGENTLTVYTSLPNDSNTYNDTINKIYYFQPTILPDYIDDFEGNSFWLGNTYNNTHWNLGAGTNYSSGTHSPTNAWVFSYSSGNGGVFNEALYSPHFITMGQDSALLDFWHSFYNDFEKINTRVEFSADNGPWQILGSINDANATNWYNTNYYWYVDHNWTESSYKLDLTNPIFNSPDTIQFRFVSKENSTFYINSQWVIDDVSFKILKLHQDVGVIAITNPDTSINLGASVNVSIDIKNYGSDTLFSIPVSYSVGTNTIHDTAIVSASGLLPDDTISFTFASSFVAPNYPFQICAKTEMNDLKPSNDEICKMLSVGLPLTDIDMIDFIVSPSWHDTTKTSFDDTVRVRVVNKGADTLTSINFKYNSIVSTVVADEMWHGILPSLDTLIYTYTNTYNSPLGSYFVCLKALVAGDYDASNNELCNYYTGIDNVGFHDNVADGFSVKQNQPNPAYDNIRIYYTIPIKGIVLLEIRDLLGQKIHNKVYQGKRGQNKIVYDASKLVSGVYFYTVTYKKKQITKKMMVH